MCDNDKKPRVSYQEQIERGLVTRPKRDNFVRSEQAAPIVRRMAPGELNSVQHTLDVPSAATMHVEMRTSAVDRSKGFLLATVPLFAAFAVGAVLIAYLAFNVPVLSVTALTVFWITFVVAWLASYVYTLAVSTEGVALFEARSKWDVVKREQAERWKYYHNGGE